MVIKVSNLVDQLYYSACINLSSLPFKLFNYQLKVGRLKVMLQKELSLSFVDKDIKVIDNVSRSTRSLFQLTTSSYNRREIGPSILLNAVDYSHKKDQYYVKLELNSNVVIPLLCLLNTGDSLSSTLMFDISPYSLKEDSPLLIYTGTCF